jgi:uncharacterized protein YkwD
MADLDNNGRRLKEQKPVSSRKTGNGFTAAQSAWQMEALNSHNSFRARHRVPPLELDDAISREAQDYADYLAKNNLFQHSTDRDGLGENLYGMGGSASVMDNHLGKLRKVFL